MISCQSLPLNTTRFPDNTSQVWKVERLNSVNSLSVVWDYSSEAEIIELAMLKDLYDSINPDGNATLLIRYLPYARQDKDVSNEATFALHTFAKILNNMNWSLVTILDPHSEIALKLINYSTAIYPKAPIARVMAECGTDLVCYPDKGALSKYSKIYSYPHIYGEKVRDQATGNILNYKLVGECAGKNVLIVDDICDGGMTFKLLAKDLLAAGANSVVLFVTHGIFSKGVRTLLDAGISRVFTSKEEVFARNQTNFV